jgi:hypothetical protein
MEELESVLPHDKMCINVLDCRSLKCSIKRAFAGIPGDQAGIRSGIPGGRSTTGKRARRPNKFARLHWEAGWFFDNMQIGWLAAAL